jgi:prepilin peptidase CpaA
MPELNLQNVVFLTCLAAFTIVAAVWDLRYRRIPNWLTVPMLALGLVFHAIVGGWAGTEGGLVESGLKSALLGFFVGFGTLFALWLVGGGGGGDVKLMGALAVWLGYPMVLLVLICSTVFVLAGTLAGMAWGVATRRASRLGRVAEPRHRRVMAFAVPVALATWTVLLWKLPQL